MRRPSSPPEDRPDRHQFGGVRPPPALRLAIFLILTLGAIWALLRQAQP